MPVVFQKKMDKDATIGQVVAFFVEDESGRCRPDPRPPFIFVEDEIVGEDGNVLFLSSGEIRLRLIVSP